MRMVDCVYMEHHHSQPHGSGAAASETAPPPRRDHDGDRATTSDAAATESRHLYTMTVDDVGAELFAYGLHRDTRTVQRWCKRGKLRAIIDHEHGDRYLIDPASLRDVIATLLAERDTQSQRHTTMPHPRPDSSATMTRQHEPVSSGYQFTPNSLRDKDTDAATREPTDQAAPDARRDEVATLERRVAELEKEKAMLAVDKEVREQMVEYLKGNFQQMLDQALTRTEELGRLQAENAQLRALLPAAPPHQSRHEQVAQDGAGQGAAAASEHPLRTSPGTMHRRAPWSPD